MNSMYPYPYVRIGETADEFAHNWEVLHGSACTDMLPHRDLNNQIFMWSESCEGPPPPYAPAGRRIDQYGNIIHDEPQVTPFTPPAPVSPPPKLFETTSKPPGVPLASVPVYQTSDPLPPPGTQFITPIGPATPPPVVQQPPVPPPPPVTQQPPAAPPVFQPPAPPAPPQVFKPPYPFFPYLPFKPPISVIDTRPNPIPVPSINASPTAPSFTTQPPGPTSKLRELGVTLLMLAPALIPLALTALPHKKRARS